jgi:tRNA (mo5U34)-methyltransferase
MMDDYEALYQMLSTAKALEWVKLLPQQIQNGFDISTHGTSATWQKIIADLPEFPVSVRNLNADKVQIGQATDLTTEQQTQLKTDLMAFHPWRKGPYDLFGIHVDTEWRSDWKWQRLKDHLSPLKNRLVLDVGCGNGYHCWRMLGAGAKMVVGIDPTLINVMQFQLIKKLYGNNPPVYVLPVGIEELPLGLKAFDTVFSMGVLYHRRSPLDHLLELREALKSGGELVLETLIVEGGLGQALLPEDRYAKMRNVWFLPSCETLISWLKRCGFKNIRVVNVCKTTTEEQRTTDWMTFYSLANFLDPENPNLTCEGLPAPTRAIVIANTD